MKSLFFLITVSIASGAHAIPILNGNDQGNGGDICELRISEIRNDIHSWLEKQGHRQLRLPTEVSHQDYAKKMIATFGAKISCTDQSLTIHGAEKVCVNSNQLSNRGITCNSKKFFGLSQEDQYLLVHHEFAGLAGLETNEGAKSNYFISSQISKSLTVQIVKKLSIVAPGGTASLTSPCFEVMAQAYTARETNATLLTQMEQDILKIAKADALKRTDDDISFGGVVTYSLVDHGQGFRRLYIKVKTGDPTNEDRGDDDSYDDYFLYTYVGYNGKAQLEFLSRMEGDDQGPGLQVSCRNYGQGLLVFKN